MGGTLDIIRKIMFIIVVLGIIGLSFLFLFDGQVSKIKEKISFLKGKKPIKKDKKETKRNAKGSKKEKINTGYTQDTLPFDTIETFSEDDPTGLIVKTNERTFVGIVEVFGINFNLLDVPEREVLEKSFETLLNGLDYPIQLYIQSRKIDIDNYKKIYEERITQIKKNLDKTIDKINFVKDTNSDSQELLKLIERGERIKSQYNYGVLLKEYIITRCKQKNMLERRYFIAISYTHNPSKFKEELTKREILSQAFFDFQNKASTLVSALQGAKLEGKLLNGKEIAELLYISYNKADSEYYKIENAFNSKFSHLYTTAESVEVKSMKRRLKEIEKTEKDLEKEIAEKMEKRNIKTTQEKVGA